MDVEKMAEAVFTNVRAFVLKSLEPITGRLERVEQSVKDLPVPSVVTAEKVAPLLMPALLEEVRREIASLPPPKDGEHGKSVSLDEVAALFERRFSDLSLQWERNATEVFQRAIDRMPKPKDGIDAFSLDDFDARLDPDGRTVMLSFTQGERQVHKHLPFPVVIDKGFWKDGFLAEKGDGLTFGGSYWIALKDTDTKPEIGNPDWRLCVRKGRDGKSVK